MFLILFTHRLCSPQALEVLTSPALLGLGSSLEPPQLPGRNCPGDTSERRNRSMERTYERRAGTECVGFLDLLRRRKEREPVSVMLWRC